MADVAGDVDGVVKDAKCLLACVTRMHLSNEALMFWNASHEFRLMLRNDPDEPGVLCFELCVVPGDEDDDPSTTPDVTRVLEMEYDGYYDDGAFIVDSFSVPLDEAVRRPELLDDARRAINRVFNFGVCPCGSYFIKDAAKMCLFCQLTSGADDAEHFCAICHDSGIERHMVKQACCSQLLHRACLARWEHKARSSRCPLCRADAAAG